MSEATTPRVDMDALEKSLMPPRPRIETPPAPMKETLGKIPERQVITITLPPGTEIYANDIRRFVDAMLFKMAKHRGKGRWNETTLPQAMTGMEGEVRELYAAIAAGNTIETMLEAADVANYAMIVSSIAVDKGR
jgi:hypothetical protein